MRRCMTPEPRTGEPLGDLVQAFDVEPGQRLLTRALGGLARGRGRQRQARQPLADRVRDGIGVCLQAVIPGDAGHLPVRTLGRPAEAVAFALDHQHRELHRLELGEPALGRLLAAARRNQRKGEAEHGDGTGLLDGPASDARSERAAAHDQWQAGQLIGAELRDHDDPGLVESLRGSGRAPACHPIGLLDQRDGEAGRARRLSGGGEIRRLDPPSGTVTENDRGPRAVDPAQVSPGGTGGSVDLRGRQWS
jgi:hypothetical protein